MPGPLQAFLADATVKAAAELTAAYERLPEDQRDWSPAEGGARSSRDQIAECVVSNGYVAEQVRVREVRPDVGETYGPDKAAAFALADAELLSHLAQSAHHCAETIRAVPDSDLGVHVDVFGEPTPLSEIMVVAFWNMTYHLGQVNYIASLLGHSE